MPQLTEIIQTLSQISLTSITSFLLKLIGVVILIIIGFVVAKAIRKLVSRATQKAKIEDTISSFIARVAYWAVIILVALACLSIFGVETTSVAAVIGAAGLAIGLAFQGTLSNFAAGFMLVIFRPFKVGDTIVVEGHTGKVVEIDFFETIVNTPDMRRVIIPNSKIYGSTIQNITANPMRRIEVQVGVAYDADIEQTRKVLEDACNIEGRLEDPASAVIMKKLDDSAVLWECRVWCKTPDFFATQERLVVSIKKKLDEAGIDIPFPQVTVSHKS